MTIYILRRIIRLIITLFIISIVSFVIIHISPGSPIGNTLNPHATPEQIEFIKRQYHLDKPLYVQYILWLKNLFGGSLVSFKDQRPVLQKIKERLPYTILLNIVSILIIWTISFPVGIYAAKNRGKLIDKIITFLCFFFISVPSFWLGYLLIILFVKYFHVNVIGPSTFGLDYCIWDRIWHLFLPSLMVSLTGVAVLSRYVRAQIIEVIHQDYITTAKAKGADEDRIYYIHALRNALLPFITMFGMILPGLISGSVIIETIFNWPGIGRLAYESVLERDYPTIMTLNLIAATLTLIGTFISDLLYMVADPRVRLE